MNGYELKEARKQLGLTQAALGKELGFTSYVQIGKYEREEAPVPRTTELAIKYLLLINKDQEKQENEYNIKRYHKP